MCNGSKAVTWQILGKKLSLYSFVYLLSSNAVMSSLSIDRPGLAQTTSRSPYVEQLGSQVRGLSKQEVDDLLNGRGAGYARSAELNSYPGPRHVLDLKQKLNLSPKQTQQIEAVFKQMQVQAKQLGQEIIKREAKLSTAFNSKTISEAEMKSQTENLAQLYGQLRATHLQAHLQIKPLLSAKQVAEYNKLRGYTNAAIHSKPSQHEH